MEQLQQIIDRQRDFQELCGVNISTNDNHEKNLIAEVFLFKLIEEVVELRKTQPSALNSAAKTQPQINRQEMLNELADVCLFLINFTIIRDITTIELLNAIKSVQDNNFAHRIKKLEGK